MVSKINKYEEQIKESRILKHMHLPGGKEGDLNDPKNTLYSVHQRGKHKTLWYLSSWETMESQNIPTNREMVTYKSKIFPFTHLHRSILTTLTPRIQVKEGYKIRFCDDLFLNMIKEFNLYLNDVHLQLGNHQSLICQIKNHNNWDKFSKQVGNQPSLTSWCSEIDEHPLALYLPWFYAKDKSDSFPLKFCGHHDRLHHVIEFNLRLSELLLIKDTTTNEIVNFDSSLITVSENKDSIDIPEMEGLYSLPTKKECDINDCTMDEVDGEKELYTESIYYIEDENEVDLGKKIQLKIDSKSRQPVNSIYWGAINKQASQTRKKSVFHFNHAGRFISPIKFSKIESSYGTIMENKSSYKTECAYLLPLEHGMKSHVGINFYSNSILTKEDDRKFPTGIVLGGGTITIVLKEPGRFDCSDKFLTFAVLKYIRRFKFKNYPKTQNDRLNMGCTIEQEDDE
tara:strand:- start:518 stop:1882 length:1365 start_codon:yes stop_codon:yes gene_type:complete